MDDSALENSSLFKGIPAKDLRDYLERIPHPVQHYDKDETVFFLMESAERIGIVLEGHVQAQKTFIRWHSRQNSRLAFGLGILTEAKQAI